MFLTVLSKGKVHSEGIRAVLVSLLSMKMMAMTPRPPFERMGGKIKIQQKKIKQSHCPRNYLADLSSFICSFVVLLINIHHRYGHPKLSTSQKTIEKK